MLWRCARKLYPCVEGVGVTEATPSTGWTVAGSGWIHRWEWTWRSSSQTQKSRPPHHQAYEGNHTRPKNEMTWQDNSGRLGLLALPFSDNKDQQGLPRGRDGGHGWWCGRITPRSRHAKKDGAGGGPKMMPPTLTRLTVSDKIIIYMHTMRQTNATIKCNKPTGVYNTAF